MKPTTSALRHFVLGAAATAAVSSSSKSLFLTVAAQTNGSNSSRLAKARQSAQQQDDMKLQDFTTPKLYDDQTKRNKEYERYRRSDWKFQDRNLEFDNDIRYSLNDEGVLISSSPSNPITNQSTNNKKKSGNSGDSTKSYTHCHPDLGALACSRAGEVCTEMSRSSASFEADGDHNWNWYCLPQSMYSTTMAVEDDDKSFSLDMTTNSSRKSQTQRSLFNEFPPTGPVYDKCTYELQYKYNYFSSIKKPSAWDRCACKGYNYNLPSETMYYTDVEYCHKINKYYCQNYYTALDTSKAVTQYDACVCATYSGKPIPEKPDDFCVELPTRYCEAYYPNGDLLGVAKCLCDNFEYEDWCNWTPPPNFSPVAPPPPPVSMGPSKPPTRFPTSNPTLPPTQQPTGRPTRDPTKRPTLSPTFRPTPSPTRQPTAMPTRSPTKDPTRDPTLSPTRHPTRAPSNPATSEPTKSPTERPTNSPTLKPTLFPTRKPLTKPNHIQLPIADPLPTPEPKPTAQEDSGKDKAKDKNENTAVDEKQENNNETTTTTTTNNNNIFVGGTNDIQNEDMQQPPPVATGENLHNINKLQSIIVSLRRQPNLSQRPGSALRLQANNLFDRNDDLKEGGSF